MGRPITSLTRDDKKRAFKWKSPQARARSAAAGAANLAKYRARLTSSLEQPRTTHGVQAFLTSGDAPAAITEKLDTFEAGLLADLGGDPTTAQRGIIESARTALGVVLLAYSYLSQGSLSKFKRNRWILSTLATYLNTLRLNLTALGLGRRTKDALTLDSVLDDIAQKRGHDA